MIKDCFHGVIICTPSVRIFDHLNIFGCSLKTMEIGAARGDFEIVTRDTVEHADGMIANFSVASHCKNKFGEHPLSTDGTSV
jgi:hypothetical protein